jgi:DNA polymerase-3 subunit delta
LKDPSPGVALIFEAMRFDFEGDDKRKQERVRKFYASVQEVVELRRFGPTEARQETDALARRAGFRLDPAAADLLVEALGADIARIAVEIEKLALYAGTRVVGVDDIGALVPDARSTTIFALVNALGRRDRARSLEILDTLAREGEYLPLALAFLSSQFRMALVANEAGLKNSQQILGYFQRLGVAMWPSRADQIQQTAAKFAAPQLERAIRLIFEADRGLRDARPDDRIVMEQFVLKLTA